MITRMGVLAGLLAPVLSTTDAPTAARSSDRVRLGAFCDLFYTQKKVREAFETYVAADYIQHSKGIGQGRETAITFLEPMFARDAFHLEPVQIMLDGQMAAVVLNVTAGPVRAIVIDLFRLHDGLIVEHWDVKSEISAEAADFYFKGFSK
jgi:predicted SnoaL-like aldol condensation-catalyzing enzyme